MTIKKLCLVVIIISICLSSLIAEMITLKDGKQIEGEILSMNAQFIVLEKITGDVIKIDVNDIGNINYSETNQPLPQEQMNQNHVPGPSAIPQSNSHIPVPVNVTPINPNPYAYVEQFPMRTGLLDPELEARKRLVAFNEQMKNPLLSTSLGLVFPGAGHFYCEKIAAGFFFLGTRVVFAGMTWYGFSRKIDPNTMATSYNDIVIGSAGAVGFVTMTVIEAINAYSCAEDFNRTLRLKLGIDTLHEQALPAFNAQH